MKLLIKNNQQYRQLQDIHHHTGGLEIKLYDFIIMHTIHHHTGGLETSKPPVWW
jgi:hypothetical protein